jgi:hypothetical protein
VAKVKRVYGQACTTDCPNGDDVLLQAGLHGAYTVIRHGTGVPGPGSRDTYLSKGVELMDGAPTVGTGEVYFSEAWA